ncbi:MAG: GNAT family N-acetyltransferase [Gammaproteobacteria bacterium]|nr:GNAT family N-acetyltransferase [Gammaproteobacteria bacterium]
MTNPVQKALTKPFDALTAAELESRNIFDCGELTLNEYLTNKMRNHHDKNIAKSYLYTENDKILGYYTLTPTVIELNPDLAKKLKLPKHSLPAMLLARLAIDKSCQGKGFGELLLAEAVIKSAAATKSVGGVGLVVDALHQNASNFYQKYGFAPSPTNPLWLFMPLPSS